MRQSKKVQWVLTKRWVFPHFKHLMPGQQMLFHLENMEGNSRLFFNVILSKTKQQHFQLMLIWLLWFSFVFVLFILLLAMSCSMWNLSSLTRIEPAPPAVKAGSLLLDWQVSSTSLRFNFLIYKCNNNHYVIINININRGVVRINKLMNIRVM